MTAKEKPKIPLPKGWTGHVRSAVLHVIGLAQYATAYTRSWAANSPNERMRLKAENDRLESEVALLKEEIRIKDARLLCWDSRKRPQYPPTERMAILELRAARSWSKQKTADAFHLTAATITTWCAGRRLPSHRSDHHYLVCWSSDFCAARVLMEMAPNFMIPCFFGIKTRHSGRTRWLQRGNPKFRCPRLGRATSAPPFWMSSVWPSTRQSTPAVGPPTVRMSECGSKPRTIDSKQKLPCCRRRSVSRMPGRCPWILASAHSTRRRNGWRFLSCALHGVGQDRKRPFSALTNSVQRAAPGSPSVPSADIAGACEDPNTAAGHP